MFSSLSFSIAVVAHNAGSANHIIRLVKNLRHDKLRLCTWSSFNVIETSFPDDFAL